jgi:hypothetical protein
MKSLDDILSDEEEIVVPAAEQETEKKPPEPLVTVPDPGVVRDEHGRFAPKGVEESVPPAPKTDQLPPEEYKALKAEREKRQTLEAELAQLRAAKPQEPPAPPPSIWDDEQGAFQHFGQEIMSRASLNAKLDMSEMMMRQANPDFEEMKQVFVALMAENPGLQQQALADPHPWNKAYQIAKNHKAMQELSAVDVADLETKIRAKIEAEMSAQAPTPRVGLPITLSNERNVGSRTGPAWNGPQSIEDILR